MHNIHRPRYRLLEPKKQMWGSTQHSEAVSEIDVGFTHLVLAVG